MYKIKNAYIENKSPCCDIYDIMDKHKGDLISTELICLIRHELINVYGQDIPIKLVEDLVKGKKWF